MMGYHKRFDPSYLRARRAVQEMRDLRYVEVTVLHPDDGAYRTHHVVLPRPDRPWQARPEPEQIADTHERVMRGALKGCVDRIVGDKAPAHHRVGAALLFESLIHDIDAVRGFNRFYTNALGLLRGKYLDTPYSLTEARLLFELAQRDTSEVTDLRRTVDIDPGYLSRILARFESDGVIARQRSAADGRRQVIQLTGSGREVVAGLDAERERLLVTWNATHKAYPDDASVHELFEQQVKRTPDAVALVCEDQQRSYDELNRTANQLARHLRNLGAGPEVLVGICLERSVDLLTGVYGILKAGAAYVPLDPAYPADRLALMVEDARCPILLTQHGLLHRLPPHHAKIVCIDTDWGSIEREAEDNLDSGVTGRNVSYVIYTSGSTGRPKGVRLTHRGMLWSIHDTQQKWPTNTAEVIDLNQPTPTWRLVAPMSIARRQVNATLLPDGTVLVTGGTSGGGFNNLDPSLAAYLAELWDPATETWRTLASANTTIPRLYHSAATLLPDGRVLVTGGNDQPTPRKSVLIRSAPWVSRGRWHWARRPLRPGHPDGPPAIRRSSR
jgi:DNA-binding MarR family transcriptional regulator